MNPDQQNSPNNLNGPVITPDPDTPSTPPPQPASFGAPPSPQPQSKPKKKITPLKMVALALSIIVLIIIVPALFGLGEEILEGDKSETTQNSNSSANSGLKDAPAEYVDPEGRFKIKPPADWYQVVVPKAGEMLNLRAKQANSEGVTPVINVAGAPAEGGTLEEFTSSSKKTLAAQTQNYEVLESKKVTISGVPGELVTSSFTRNGNDTVSAQLVVIKNDILYSVVGVSSKVSWSKDKATLQNSLLSFKLN